MNPAYFLGIQKDTLKPSFKLPEDAMQESGLTYFSYGLLSHGEALLTYFTHEEWGHLYQEKHYNKIDPLLRGVVHSHFPLIVWDALHPFGKEKKVMAERNEVCNLKSGLTVGINNKGYTEIIALGSEIPPQDFYHLLRDETYIHKIYEMISKFYKTHKESFPLLTKTSTFV
jgi:hypothetical protein